jgi:hypothetical protein
MFSWKVPVSGNKGEKSSGYTNKVREYHFIEKSIYYKAV